MDLEFCIQCIVISTSKIFCIGLDLNELEITTLVRQSFNDGVRITLSQVLKWASTIEEARLFFSMFRMDGPEMISSKTLSDNEFITYEKFLAQNTAADEAGMTTSEKLTNLIPVDSAGRFQPKQASQLVTNRRALNFRAWLNTALQPIISYRLESKTINNFSKTPDELKVKLEWVFGIRSGDTRKALMYTVGSAMAESIGSVDQYEKQVAQNNEEIVYFVASVVVLLNQNINKQRFYLSHDQEVISVAVSNKDGGSIASGELAAKPAIHVWNRKSLECYVVIKGLHAQGVHLMQFTNDDKYLVTCGLTLPSAVIIYDWAIGQVVISTAIHSPTQEIFLLQEITKNKKPVVEDEADPEFMEKEAQKVKSGIVVLSMHEIIIFTLREKSFTQSYLPLDQAKEDSELSKPICGMAIIADHKNHYFKALDEDLAGQRHLFLTGHKNGKVLMWRSDSYIGVLTDYKDEITCMSKCFEGIVICTWRGNLHIWDTHLTRSVKTIELSALPFKVLSFNIMSIDFNQKRLLVLTLAGDAVEITLTESGGFNSNKVKAKRINAITKISGQQKGMTILNQIERSVIIGGDDGLVTSYDLQTHELIDVWAVGSKVTALATLSLEEGGFIIAAGTAVGNLILRQDWEEIIPRYHACGSKTINDLQFSKNGQLLAAASSDKHIYLFQYSDGDYIKLAACKLENGFAVSLNFSQDSKKIVICTNQRKLLLLDPVTFQLMFKVEDLSQCFWPSWLGRYPLVTKSQTSGLIPICLGNLSNIVVAGDENGNIYAWRDVESIKEHIGINLTGHSSPLQRISLTEDDKRLISMGANDQSLMLWRMTNVEQKQVPEAIDQKKKKAHQQVEQKIILEDNSLINELNFCFVNAVVVEEKESGAAPLQPNQVPPDTNILIRGCNNSTVNRVNAKLNFEFEEATWKRPPAVALVIDHIYGVQTSDRRQTVMYLHFHNEKPKVSTGNQSITSQLGLHGDNNSRLDQVLPKLLGANYQQLLDPNQAIHYDEYHQNCHKHLCYFTSRFAILYSPIKNAQTFYQGHNFKISCMVKHPFRRVVATGEVNNQPQIHIWDAQTLEQVIVIETSHRGGILHLAFSPDGRKLISIGMDRTFSVQVFQWEQNRTLAFRNLGYQPVFGLKFYPHENSKFVTCGYEHMAVWRLQGNHLTCQTLYTYQTKKVDKDPNKKLRSVLMCLEFLSYRLGHSIQSDVIFGTSQGEITTYCSGKHFVLNENAHKGAINCMKVSDRINDAVNIITGGEDGFIKFWDTSFSLIQVVDVRNIDQVLKDFKNQMSYGVQSIDVYCCDRQEPRRLLVGLRCGEVLEAVITDQEGKAEAIQMAKRASQALGTFQPAQEMLKLSFYTYVSAHSSLCLSPNQKKVQCAMNPLYAIMASVGDDETLRFWDINKKQLVTSKCLGTQATSLAFSPDGTFLIIGLINGVLLVLESRVEKLNFGTYMEQYTMPTLEVVMSPKEAKAAVVTIKFSYRGDYLAVSFNNEFRMEMTKKADGTTEAGAVPTEGLGSREPAFVLIYANRLSVKNPGIKMNSRDPYVKLLKIVLPLADFQSSANLRAQLAVTQMDFSEDDTYMQMSVQKINAEVVMDTSSYLLSDDIYVVWNIQTNQMVTNFELLKNVQWPDWSVAPAVNARFLGTDMNLEDAIEERQLLFREQCFMSKIARFSLLDNAIVGSHQGGLYLFRFPALIIEKLKVVDFRYDFIRKNEMAASRSFSGHTSMILSIEIFEDRNVLSTSVSDQCIVQWRVEYEDQHWELDFNNYIRSSVDPFAEVPQLPKFEKLLNEIWSQRLQVSEINQGVSKKEYSDPACELELQYIIGRRAFDRRGNVKIDCMDRVTYQAGALQIFLTENDAAQDPKTNFESKIKQVFLRPEPNKFKSISAELSCFCLSKDLRILFIATAQIESNIYIWEVTTNMSLGKIIVPNVPIVLNIKCAYDARHLLIVGLTKEYYQCMMLIDWTQEKFIFQRIFIHSLPFKIKDIDFFPDSTRKFVTCGIQHLCFWTSGGKNLEYQVGELTIPKAFTNIGTGAYSHNPANQGKFGISLVTDDYQNQIFQNQKGVQQKSVNQTKQNADDDLENLFVTFLNLTFIGDTLITSGDDGFLYLWDKERIIRRVFAHEGSIFAIHSNPKLGLIVSGGIEGIVTLWRLLVEQKSNVKSLERLKIYNLRKNLDPQQAVLTPECNIQSVCIGYNRILVGMRTGSIFEVQIAEDSKIIKPHHDASVDPIKMWLRCADHQMPKSVGMDMISSRIFTLTQNGIFLVWNLQDFNIIYHKNFNKPSRNLQSFKLFNLVMLVFDHEIIVLDTNPKKNTFDELPDYALTLNTITYATINNNEQLLGVATISAATPEVTLFATDGGFMKLKQIFGFKSSIKYLDFSTDNFYMQCEDNVGEITLYEIETDRPIQTDAIDFELEWLGEGLRTYSRLKGVRHQYNPNNKIQMIKKLLGKPVVVISDEMGTIRLFNYPNVKGEPYYNCYSEHLFQIADCMFSADRMFFLSACEMDRCVFKWKIKLNETKIQRMIEEDKRKLNEISIGQKKK